MEFILKTTEVSEKHLIKLNAGNGDFYVCNAGARREIPYIFFYGDEFDQFFFAAKWITRPDKVNEIAVYDAFVRRLGLGGEPTISATRLGTIQKNIEHTFKTQRFFLLEQQPILPQEAIEYVTFSWKFSFRESSVSNTGDQRVH